MNTGILPGGYRNFGGAAQTTTFGIDSTLDILVTPGSVNAGPTSPNSGSLFTLGALAWTRVTWRGSTSRRSAARSSR